MEHGVVAEQGPTDDVTVNSQHEYTRRLVADVPSCTSTVMTASDSTSWAASLAGVGVEHAAVPRATGGRSPA